MSKRFLIITSLVLLCQIVAFPQKKADFRMWEDSLVHLRDRVMAEPDETARLALNEDFMTLLEEVLQMPDAFKYTWDSVKNFSVLASPDNVFKIFTWYVVKDNYDIENFGFIHVPKHSYSPTSFTTGHVMMRNFLSGAVRTDTLLPKSHCQRMEFSTESASVNSFTADSLAR